MGRKDGWEGRRRGRKRWEWSWKHLSVKTLSPAVGNLLDLRYTPLHYSFLVVDREIRIYFPMQGCSRWQLLPLHGHQLLHVGGGGGQWEQCLHEGGDRLGGGGRPGEVQRGHPGQGEQGLLQLDPWQGRLGRCHRGSNSGRVLPGRDHGGRHKIRWHQILNRRICSWSNMSQAGRRYLGKAKTSLNEWSSSMTASITTHCFWGTSSNYDFPRWNIWSARDSGEIKTVHSSKDQRIVGLALVVAEVLSSMSLIVPWFTLMTTWWPQVHFHFHPLLHDSHVIFEGGEGCTPVHRHDRVHIEVPRLRGKDEGGGRVHQAHQLLRGLAQQQGVEEHREEDLAPRSFLRLLMFLVLAGALFFYMIYMLFVFFVFFCPL